MSWTKAIKAAAFALACGVAGSALAGTIVIRADGPSKRLYPPGKTLAGRIALARGDTLVVLDARGTRTLSGPGTIDLAAQGGSASSALTALIANSGSRQVRTGAVRGGANGVIASPSLWYVDAGRGGTICLPDLTRATLWRNDGTSAAAWTLTRVRDGKTATLNFAARQNVRSWPVTDLGLAEGTDYRLSGPGLAAPVMFRFVIIAPPAGAPEEVAAALLAKGCKAQLDQLVEAGRSAPAG